jgi:hypothetical protein
MRLTAALTLTVAIALAGCGYKLGEIRPTPMRSVRSLAVPNFKNTTYIPRIETLMADTLVKGLQRDGTYKVLPEAEADAILNCTVTKVIRVPIRSVQNNVLATSEFALAIEASYEVQDRITGAILMKGTLIGKTTFFSGNDLVTIERQAISNAAADLANNITVAVSEGW